MVSTASAGNDGTLVKGYEKQNGTYVNEYWRGPNGEHIDIASTEVTAPTSALAPALKKKNDAKAKIGETSKLVEDSVVTSFGDDVDNVPDEELARETRVNKDREPVGTSTAASMLNGANAIVSVNGWNVSDWGTLQAKNGNKYLTVSSASDPKKSIRIPKDQTVKIESITSTDRARRARWRIDYDKHITSHDEKVKERFNAARDKVTKAVRNVEEPSSFALDDVEEARTILKFKDNVNDYAKQKGIASRYDATVDILSGRYATNVLHASYDDPRINAKTNASYLDEYDRVATGIGEPTPESQQKIRAALHDELDIQKQALEKASTPFNADKYVKAYASVKLLAEMELTLGTRDVSIKRGENADGSHKFMNIVNHYADANVFTLDYDGRLDSVVNGGSTSTAERSKRHAELNAQARMIATVLQNGDFKR